MSQKIQNIRNIQKEEKEKIKENDYILIKGYNSYRIIPDILKTFGDKFYYISDKRECKLRKGLYSEYINVTILTKGEIIKLLLENLTSKKNKKFPHLILDNLSKNTLIINLWKEIYESKNISKLFLISDSPNVLQTSLEFTKDNTILYTKNLKRNPIRLEYYNRDINHKNNDDIINKLIEVIIYRWKNQKRDEVENDIKWLVILPSKKECNKVYHNLKNSIDADKYNLPNGYNIIMINEETDIKYIKRINEKKGKKIIVSCVEKIPIDDINGVFDSMLKTVEVTNNLGIKWFTIDNITKDEADCRLNNINSTNNPFCYRLCRYDFFQKLYNFVVPHVIRLPQIEEYLMLKMYIKGDISPYFTLDMKEKKMIQKRYDDDLINLHLLKDKNNITKRGKEILIFWDKIDFYTSLFIIKWKEKKLPLFPGIVYINIVKLFLYNFGRWGKDGIGKLEYLLGICKDYFKEFKSLDSKIPTKDYCKIREVNTQSFKELLENIRNTIEVGDPIPLGLYTVENVLHEGNNIMREIFYDKVLHIVEEDHKKIHYIDEEKNLYILDDRFINKYFSYPSSLFCIEKFKKDGKYIIKNFIPL